MLSDYEHMVRSIGAEKCESFEFLEGKATYKQLCWLLTRDKEPAALSK